MSPFEKSFAPPRLQRAVSPLTGFWLSGTPLREKSIARRGVSLSLSLTMLVCPRTSLLRAYGRLDMLGVVGKELDVQMSPD